MKTIAIVLLAACTTDAWFTNQAGCGFFCDDSAKTCVMTRLGGPEEGWSREDVAWCGSGEGCFSDPTTCEVHYGRCTGYTPDDVPLEDVAGGEECAP